MKNLAIAFILIFSFLIFPCGVQSQTAPVPLPSEVQKFHQAVTQILAQTPHSPAFAGGLTFDAQNHDFILLAHYFSRNNEVIAREIASITISNITLANYQERTEDFGRKLRSFFQEREAAQQRGELKPLNSFVILTPNEVEYFRLFSGFLAGQQTLQAELAQVNDKFVGVKIFPGLSQGQRVFHFYVGADETRGAIWQFHYYPVAEFPISQITSTQNPTQELSADLILAFEAASNKLHELR